MQIQCPSCQARSTLSDQHEGAKVRCAECGRVYVARPKGAVGTRSGGNTGLWVGAGVGAVALFGLVFVLRSRGAEPITKAAPVVAEAAPPVVHDTGWNSEVVRTVVALHDAAFARDRERLKPYLHGERVWQREQTAGGGEPARTFAALAAHERVEAYERWAAELTDGASKPVVAEWQPYDGSVIERTDTEAVVRLQVKPRAGGIESRWVEWHLAKDGPRYKAWSWARWISPDEEKAEKRKKGFEVVELSDGSIVHERQPEALGHLADTPEALRGEIDALLTTLLDLELTREATRARRRLAEIGRPAIPPLLTKFFEIPAESEQDRIRCNLLDQTLQDITGQSFGYAPGESGSVAGTTEERRQSSIKQWFAWWYKNEKRFRGKVEGEDALEGLIELDAAEKRWLERHSDEKAPPKKP